MPRGNYVRKPNAKKRWTPEDEAYLQDSWGKVSVPGIAKHLGRTEAAITNRVQYLGLGAAFHAGEWITWNQFYKEINGADNGGGYFKKRMLAAGFPVHYQIVKGKNKFRYTMVDIDEFWEFAEDHKDLFDFSKFEPYTFGSEPEWAAVKRRADVERAHRIRPHNTPWTSDQDRQLEHLLRQHRYSYTEIAERLRRTEGAVKRRISTLGITERPVRMHERPWTKEEEQKLIELQQNGIGWDNIAKELKRTALCCKGKYERILNPLYTKTYYRNLKRDAAEKKIYEWTKVRDITPGELQEHLAVRELVDGADWQQGVE